MRPEAPEERAAAREAVDRAEPSSTVAAGRLRAGESVASIEPSWWSGRRLTTTCPPITGAPSTDCWKRTASWPDGVGVVVVARSCEARVRPRADP